MLLSLVDGPPAVQLTTEQAREVTRRLDRPAPRYTTHEEVAAFFGHSAWDEAPIALIRRL